MGADNWDICPRCVHRAEQAQGEKIAEVGAMYGKVPVEEFDAARREIRVVEADDFRTFAEYYEFWIEDGEVKVSYSGNCRECRLEVSFKDSRHLWSPADDEEGSTTPAGDKPALKNEANNV